MGARNVAACFAMWAHLDHAPFRLLVGMALVALDEDRAGREARMYFGGQDALVELLGRSRPAMYKALVTLREKGAIEVAEEGRNGRRAVYRLHLDPTSSVSVSDTLEEAGRVSVSETLDGPPEAPQGLGERDPAGSRSGDTKGLAQVTRRVSVSETPRNHGGTTKESLGGEHRGPAPQNRARGPLAAHPEDSSPTDETNHRPAPPPDDRPPPSPDHPEVSPAQRARPLTDVPLTDAERREYEQASHDLRKRLGPLDAIGAVLAYADAHDLDVMRATIQLARSKEPAA